MKLSERMIGFADRGSAAAVRLGASIRRRLWTVSPSRAWVEAGLSMALLLVVVLPPMKSAPGLVIPATFLLFSLLCGVVVGLRMRLVPGPGQAALLRETLLSVPLAVLLALVCTGILWMDGAFWLLESSVLHPSGTLLVIGMCIPAYLSLRALARLLLWWDELRQRRFVWALTHAQLMVVVLVGLLLMLGGMGVIGYTVAVELNNLAALPGSPPYSVFMQVILWLLGLAFLTVLFIAVGILVLFPLALLFSYLVARGLTRRVESLAQAAARVRAGDLSVRLPVEGQDELAQLQENFNWMTSDLEQRTRDLEVRTLELQAERDRTAALLKSHRELTVSVSHELRTPVATALTYLDSLFEHRYDEPGGDVWHDLQILSAEVNRLERLLDDLFTLSRVEMERLSLEIKPVEVVPLLQRLVETVEKPAWELRRVQVMLAANPLPLVAHADPVRLEQMIGNFVQNSLRHTPPGGYILLSAESVGSVETVVSVEPVTSQPRIRIRVEDSGEGIDSADLPHVWERFYRSASARQAGDGSGLGLALVKELAEVMGGQVGVESSQGEGSTFWVILPACDTIET